MPGTYERLAVGARKRDPDTPPNEFETLEAAEMIPIRHWPFAESPGDFTERLRAASQGRGGLLAGVRTVLIEDPPALSERYLKLIELEKPK